ncbi:MAG: PEGA domain-containing protein [Deltaproteobacteria bacterium]|nr:MAG: PEGA domain-containing protein [Deltaproteobacteria bacterium]TMQ18039.1 MAG: PEGA domain-containing protein [Deltaproteobacteria bacterium]
MRAWVHGCVLCVWVAWTASALGAPGSDALAKYKLAAQLEEGGNYEAALVRIEEGLAIAPRDLALLGLKGTVLLKLRDYAGALAAYQVYLNAGAKGANRREAEKIVNNLRAVQSTFLDIALVNGPAAIYLDSKTQGVLCTAAPSCNKAVLPGDYKVIAERAGFERWTERVAVASDTTTKLSIALIEKPSPVAIRVVPADASVAIDSAPYAAAMTVAAGTHHIVVARAGYAEARLEVVAHEGKPIELDVALTPRVPIRVAPPGATLVLDGKPLAVENGSTVISPGGHVLVARARGFREQRVAIPAERAADYQLAIDLVPDPLPRSPGEEPVASLRRRIAISMLEGGGAILCIGFITAVEAQSAPDDRPIADVLLVVGGATVVTGAILWFTAPDERRPHAAQIVPVVGTGRVGFVVAGSF